MSYRYIGNKTKLLPRLLPVIRELVAPGTTVADLMCGTGSVAEALRCSGYRVIASDIMTFAAQHAKVRLTMEHAPSFAGLGCMHYLNVLEELQDLKPVEGYLFREYGPAGKPSNGCPPRGYFTAENASKLDAIRERIIEWKRRCLLTNQEITLLHHDLVCAANKIANIAGTFGHFRSKWSASSLAPLALAPTTFLSGFRTDHLVLQGYAEELAPRLSADLCYLDPPYMKRQYAANYHLLETLARGDEPEAVGVSGLRPWRDQYSNFCSKVRIREAFALIIEPMDCRHFLISYSEDGLLGADEMLALLSRFGHVTLKTFPHQRFRSNDSPLGNSLTEYIFYLNKA